MAYGFGVDVGGTSVKLGLFEDVLVEKWEIPTRTENGGAQILPDIARAVLACLERHALPASQCCGIGIGVPGPVDADGWVNCCVNLGWGVFQLPPALCALTGLRVLAGNDANLAGLGEYWDGGGKGSSSMLMLTLGTGIGGAFIDHGAVLNGAHGVAGEIGHLTINRRETAYCTCGKRGCAEQYASARGMVQLAKKTLAQSDAPSALRQVEQLSAKELFACAAQGDAMAQEILKQIYEILAEIIADGCCLLDPELVVLGGGVSRAGTMLLKGIAEIFPRYMFHACKNTRFALATLGNDAGIYGGYRLVRESCGNRAK